MTSKLYNDADAEADTFPFWSRGEVTRIGAVLALAVVPAVIAYAEQNGSTAAPAPILDNLREQAAPSPGQLRAVRVTAFPVTTMLPSTFADRDER